MGFHFITGIMGAGKSYYGAELCLQCLEEGGIVHTNLPLKWDEVERLGFSDRVIKLPDDPAEWVREETHEGKKRWVSDVFLMGAEGSENLVVADEASLMWSADTQSQDKVKNSPLFGLVALSRHAGLDIYFLAQREGHVAKKLRDLADTRTHCVNAGGIPLVGWFCKRFLGDFKRIIFRGGDQKAYGHYWVRFKKAVGDFYQTHGMRDDLAMRTGGTRVKKSNAVQQKGMALVLGGVVLPVVLAAVLVWRTFAGRAETETAGVSPFDLAKQQKGQNVDVREVPQPVETPENEPKTFYGVGAEIAKADEHILGAVIHEGDAIIVRARGGLRLTIGAAYEGQRVVAQVPSGGAWYFLTDRGRAVLVRPLRPQERQELPPVTVTGQNPPGSPAAAEMGSSDAFRPVRNILDSWVKPEPEKPL